MDDQQSNSGFQVDETSSESAKSSISTDVPEASNNSRVNHLRLAVVIFVALLIAIVGLCLVIILGSNLQQIDNESPAQMTVIELSKSDSENREAFQNSLKQQLESLGSSSSSNPRSLDQYETNLARVLAQGCIYAPFHQSTNITTNLLGIVFSDAFLDKYGNRELTKCYPTNQNGSKISSLRLERTTDNGLITLYVKHPQSEYFDFGDPFREYTATDENFVFDGIPVYFSLGSEPNFIASDGLPVEVSVVRNLDDKIQVRGSASVVLTDQYYIELFDSLEPVLLGSSFNAFYDRYVTEAWEVLEADKQLRVVIDELLDDSSQVSQLGEE